MATMKLYGMKIGTLSDSFLSLDNSMENLRIHSFLMEKKLNSIDRSVYDTDVIQGSIRTIIDIQVEEIESLDRLIDAADDFYEQASSIDDAVADMIEESKDDFYRQYSYLKPDSEKSGWRRFCDNVGDWCKKNWKKIVITVVIVVGVVLAVAAIIATGGMALVPILTSLLTTVGVSAGTAMTIATVASLTVAVVGAVSVVASSVLNITDTWCEIDNPTFNAWQKALNITSFVSNGLYSIGGIYNGIKGITNASLRNYSKSWITNSKFRSAVSGASKYNFNLKTGSSTFWSGIGRDGDQIAANCADKMGRTTLERTLDLNKIELPTWNDAVPSSIKAWNSASSSFAMNSSGDVVALVGDTVRPDSVWNVFEKTILGVNPNIGNITMYSPSAVNVITRTTQISSIIESLFVGASQTETILKDWN